LPENIDIRRARSQEYLEFHEICDNDLPHPLTLEQRLEQRRREFEQIDHGKCIAFFAEVEGKVEGSVQLRLNDKTANEGRIHALAVRRSYRRKGIGSKLMDAVEQEAVHRKYKRIWLTVHLDNLPARQLYAGRGYQVVQADKVIDDSETIELEKMI